MHALVVRERRVGAARVVGSHRRAAAAEFRHIAAQHPVLNVVERIRRGADLGARPLEERLDLAQAAQPHELGRVAQHERVEHVQPEGGLRGDAHALRIEDFERGEAFTQPQVLLRALERRVIADRRRGVEVARADRLQRGFQFLLVVAPFLVCLHAANRIRRVRDFGSFDFLIVGAGSAGCLLANRLSRDPGTRVLLLEAGGRDNYFWIPIPVGYLYTIANPRTDWCYKTEPDEYLAGRSIHYARGRVLGGCSSINAMIYMRGQKSDWDYWASLGLRGWGWDDVLPMFRALEDYQHGAADGYGAGGEVRIEDPRVRWEILDAWRDAAAECGIPAIKVFNNGDNFGCAYFQMNQKRGRRWSATNAFLRPVLKRPNLTVLTDAHATRVRMEGRRARGVEFRRAGSAWFASARRETVLAAGAIGSPQLLQLSGIGPAPLLERLQIPVVHHLSGVGENLHDHLQIRMQYKVKDARTLNTVANSWLGKATMAAEYFVLRTGPLTMPPSQMGAFAPSDDRQPSANIEWHVQPLSLDKFGDPLHNF